MDQEQNAGSPAPFSQGAAILGLDNVPLELPLAGVGSRILAAIVDYGILAVLIGLWWTAGLITLSLAGVGEGWPLAILTLGSFLVQWGYFAAMEIAMDGQTPGKGLLHLRVVGRHGGQTGNTALVVRNLLRAVDVAFAIPTIALDPRSRRFGDMAAGTLVVHENAAPAGTVLRRPPPSWGAREIAVVESFLTRAEEIEPPRAARLAEALLAWIEREEPGLFAEAQGAAEAAEAEDPVSRLRQLLEAEAA